MIRNIKDGLSHARKDKIKIQYEIEFKKLINLSDDLIDQFLCIKWERGKNEHGSTRDIRVVDSHIENFHNSANLTDNNASYSSSSTKSNHRKSYPSNPNSSKDSNIGIGNTQTSGSSSSTTPYIELEKMPKTLTRKPSKLLLGNKIDGTNNMSGGDGIAIVPQEKIVLKVHLFSNTIHSKSDHILHTNYEQKLLNIYIHHGSNILCHTSVDLSIYTEENTNNAVIVPFPSSSLSQPTLYMNIKSTYLKYNDKPIIKASKDIISKKELGSFVPNGANRLIEYQGEVYFIKNNKNNNSNSSSGINSGTISSNSDNNNNNSKEENYQNSSKENNNNNNNNNSINSDINKDKILRFDLENNVKHSPPIIVTSEVDSNSSYSTSTHNTTINRSNSNNSNMDSNNSSFDNEKNSSQSTWDEFTEENHLKNSISEINQNKLLVQKNQEIKELNDKIKQLQDDYNDQKRLSTSLQMLIDDCRVKVLEYEEHYHRAQSLENYAKRLLNIERLEFQEKLGSLKNQIKQLQQQQQSNGISIILNNDSNNIIGGSNAAVSGGGNSSNSKQLSPTTNSEISTYSSSSSSSSSGNNSNESSPKEDIRIIEKDIQIRKEIEKNQNLEKELQEKLKEIKSLELDNSNIQSLYSKCSNEKNNLELLNSELSNQVETLRANIGKMTKSQIQEDLKRENELRKRKNSFLLSPTQENSLLNSSSSNNSGGFVNTIKSMATQSYPSIFYNPLIAWFLAILCFLMFIFKSIEC